MMPRFADDFKFDSQEEREQIPYSEFRRGRQTFLDVFLAKLSSSLLEEIKHFIEDNAERFKKRRARKKIYLLEDLFWILRFKQEEDNLKLERKGTMDAICRELENKFHRSAVTIRERMNRCLSRLEPDDIRTHIANNADFCFTKNSVESKDLGQQREREIPYQTRNLQNGSKRISDSMDSKAIQMNKWETKQLRHLVGVFDNGQWNTQTNSVTKEEYSKKIPFLTQMMEIESDHRQIKAQTNTCKMEMMQKEKNPESRGVQSSKNQSMYKCRTKPLRQRLSLIYNLKENSVICVRQSFLEKEVLSEIGHKEVVIDNSQQNKQIKEVGDIHVVHKKELNAQEAGNRSLDTSKEDVISLTSAHYNLSLIKQSKDESECGSQLGWNNKNQSYDFGKDLEETKRQLELLAVQSELNQSAKGGSKIKKTIKHRLQETILSETDNEYSKVDSVSLMDSGMIETKLEEKGPKEDYSVIEVKQQTKIQLPNQGNARQEERDISPHLVYQLSNNVDYLKIIHERPSLRVNFLWTPEEDELLKDYSQGNIDNFKVIIRCLLRYKNLSLVRQRCKFLGVKLNSDCEKMLEQLEVQKSKRI